MEFIVGCIGTFFQGLLGGMFLFFSLFFILITIGLIRKLKQKLEDLWRGR